MNNIHSLIKQVDIIRVKSGKKTAMQDPVIDENILKIFINRQECFNLVFSRTNTRELVAGILYTQGIVHTRDQILSIDCEESRQECYVDLTPEALTCLSEYQERKQTKGSSGGSFCLKNPSRDTDKTDAGTLRLTPDQVLVLIEKHFKASKLFHMTGAVHSAGLCSSTDILTYHEDIGRHNALDKMAGDIFLNLTETHDKVLTVSCRMSLEIVSKIIKIGTPVVVSNAAPTLSALKLADENNLTIIGFARQDRFNIYTHGTRVIGQ